MVTQYEQFLQGSLFSEELFNHFLIAFAILVRLKRAGQQRISKHAHRLLTHFLCKLHKVAATFKYKKDSGHLVLTPVTTHIYDYSVYLKSNCFKTDIVNFVYQIYSHFLMRKYPLANVFLVRIHSYKQFIQCKLSFHTRHQYWMSLIG